MYAELVQKRCTKCGEVKEIKEFYFVKKLNTYKSRCRTCTNKDHADYMKTEKGRVSRDKANKKKNWTTPTQKEYKSHWSRLKKYGITEQEFRDLLEKQDYKCAICNITDVESGKCLCVDHCHSTGKVRELLCNHCNSAVGMIKESAENATKLVEYLIKHKK